MSRWIPLAVLPVLLAGCGDDDGFSCFGGISLAGSYRLIATGYSTCTGFDPLAASDVVTLELFAPGDGPPLPDGCEDLGTDLDQEACFLLRTLRCTGSDGLAADRVLEMRWTSPNTVVGADVVIPQEGPRAGCERRSEFRGERL